MASERATVRNIKVEDLSPKVKDPEAAKLLPGTVFPQAVSLELHNVNVAIANGLRRAVLCEIPSYALDFDLSDFRTNNPHTLDDFTLDRLKCIPVIQSINPKTMFKLNVLNSTEVPLYVKSGMIEVVGGGSKKLPFNETFDITVLEPGRYITIDKIYLTRGYGYVHGGHTHACNVACVPLDQTPINLETREGVPSTLSDPRSHRLSFVLNGISDVNTVMKLACDEIVQRLERTVKAIPTIHSNEDIYYLVLKGESFTVGNIVVKGICEQYPDIKAVTPQYDPLTKTMTLAIRTDQDVETILLDVCKKNVKVINEIRSYFEK